MTTDVAVSYAVLLMPLATGLVNDAVPWDMLSIIAAGVLGFTVSWKLEHLFETWLSR